MFGCLFIDLHVVNVSRATLKCDHFVNQTTLGKTPLIIILIILTLAFTFDL